MTKLIFVRHGQSIGNLERRFLGHTDLPLTGQGHAQAEAVAAYLNDEKIDAVFSSDLLRARQTAEPIAAARGLTVTTDPGLREIYAGAWEGEAFTDITRLYGEAFHTFRHDLGHARPTDGESTAEVGKRVFATVARLVAGRDGETLLFASHATAICMFACEALGLSGDAVRRMALPSNASLSVFQWDGGECSLRQYSSDAYLGDLRLPAPPQA